MADRNDSNDTPVGLTDDQIALVRAHDENEDNFVSIGEAARRVMDRLEAGMGKTFTFEPFDRDTTLYAMKPSEYAKYVARGGGGTSFEDVMSLFDHNAPGVTVLFTDDAPSLEEVREALDKMPIPDAPDFSAHYDILGREVAKAAPGSNWRDVFHDHLRAAVNGQSLNDDGETPREHNERKYPDLMKRLDALRKLTDGE